MHKEAKFWDNIAEKYSRQPIADEAAYRKKLEITQGYFTPETELLELGCGTGSTAIIHAPFVKHIRAVDVSPNMIGIAQGKAAAEGLGNITFEVATCDELDVPDASLDVVMGMSILHLLEDKEAMIARVCRMLKPGGVFISSTACLTGMMRLLKPLIAIGALLGKAPQTVKCFSAKELEKSLTGAGFEIDYQWQPNKSAALFIVAKKPG
ncbi:MAG: class I SAM-dependent methyltransferase [Mariprofundaceae bacterium]|nr:class I SAM-dependent methyltransferase [Mariprofundaceae bacterium]